MRHLLLALSCAICATLSLSADDYTLGPDSQPQSAVPKGSVTKYVLKPGKFYPGTPHNYSLYVPSQYAPTVPIPYMVFLDGGGFAGNGMRVPVVLDNLIAKGTVPAMIAIFIDPGVLPTVSSDAQNRYNRIFEYDNISDRYVRFLSEELIPEIAKKYNLSKDPNDHGIGGSSTGAVGAFVAAWNRPDQFRRVLSFIGTFVDMKGADHFPALIRKTEAKPIRIFMQDGRKDHVVPNQPWGTFYAGSWPINNQVMYEAFEFAGYDVRYELGDEGHNGKHGSAILPEALRWLWREYPKPITVREPAMLGQQDWDTRGKVSTLVSADKPWQRLGGNYRNLTAISGDKDGNVFFAGEGRIYKADAAGQVMVFKDHTDSLSGLAVGPDGRLYASNSLRQRIVSYGPGGDEKVFTQGITAGRLAMNAKGFIYYVESGSRFGYLDDKGVKHNAYHGNEIATASGVALSPDQAMLIVTDARSRFAWSFQIAADGTLTSGEPFFRLEIPEDESQIGATAVTHDSLGQVYFATRSGIQMCEANGRVATILNNPELERITNVIFAGKSLDWLYVTAGDGVFRRPVKLTGTAAWAPLKPPKPPL